MPDVGESVRSDKANTFTEEQTIKKDASTGHLNIYRPLETANTTWNIDFDANDSALAEVQYSRLRSEIAANTAGAHTANFRIGVAVAGTVTDVFSVHSTGEIKLGTSRRVVLNDTGLTAGRTYTFPDISTTLVGQSEVAITSASSPYTVLATTNIIRADASGGAITINLPTAVGIAGKTYKILRTDIAASTNLITIDGSGTETIDGNLIHLLWTAESVLLESDGANWHVLDRTSPSSTGYTWKADSTNNKRYVAGLASGGATTALLTSTTAPAANTLFAYPFMVAKATKFDTITAVVTTGQASQNMRLGIYFDNGKSYPGKLLFDTGSISTNPAATKDTTITSSLQNFQAGMYWLTFECSSTTAMFRILPASGYLYFAGYDAAMGTGLPTYAYKVAHTLGALPDPYTAGATEITAVSAVGAPQPAIGLRAV